MARPTATPIPCSTPIRTTARSVTVASPNSKRLKRAMATRSPTRNSRSATKIKMAASVARGTSLSTSAKGMKRTITAAAPSAPAWVRPPAVATAPVRGGLALTGKDPTRPDSTLPAPTPRKSRPDVDVIVALLGKGARRGGGLGEDDQRHHRGQRRQASERRPRQSGQPEVGHAGVHRAQHGDAMSLEVEGAHQRRGDDEADQCSRDAAVGARAHHEGQDPEADGERPPVHLVEVGEHVGHPVLVAAGGRGEAEEVGQLVGDDDEGHAGQEAGDDGGRQELGDPAEAQEADQHHDEPDHDRQDPHEVDVTGRAGQGERRNPGREQRCDRRVGAHRHLRVGAQEGEEHRPGHEGVEAGDGRHPGQAGRGQLLGQGDHQEGQAGHQVGARPGAPVPVQRGQEGRRAHADIIAHLPLRRIDPIDI